MGSGMTRKKAGRRSSSRKYVYLTAVLLVGVGLWSVYWITGRQMVAGLVADNVAQARAAGVDLECASQRLGGFPFRFELSCTPLDVKLQGRGSVEVPAFRAVAMAYNPQHLIFEADAPSSIVLLRDLTAPSTAPAVSSVPDIKADWLTARASLRLSVNGLEAFDALTEDLTLNFAALPAMGAESPLEMSDVSEKALGANSGVFSAERMAVHMRKEPGSETGLELALRFKELQNTTGSAEPSPAVDLELRLGLANAQPLLSGRAQAPLAQYFSQTGDIEVHSLTIKSGSTKLSASGKLRLDDLGRLSGDLPVEIVGAERIRELLTPLFPAGSNIPATLQGAVQGFGTPTSADDGGSAVAVSLKLERGRARVGMIPVADFAPLF